MKSAKPAKQPLISEAMKAWSTALAAETADWPNISQRSFFGFTALYRGDQIFAMLPRSRNIDRTNKIAFRIDAPSTVVQKRVSTDERISLFPVSKKEIRLAGSPSCFPATRTCTMLSTGLPRPMGRP